MKTTVKLGEIQTKIIDDVKKTDELKVLLRIGWGAETTSNLSFKPTEDLKIGDEIKVTIEKVYEDTETEGEEEATAAEVSESLKAEDEEAVTAAEVSEPLKTDDEEEGTAEKI